MRVRALAIRNFRGIRSLEWQMSGRFVCLIGSGDTCKTTILDAIESALSPRWRLSLSDADFYGCGVAEPILIDVTVSDLPPELTREEPYGHWLRGIAPNGSIVDEPGDDDEPALTVRLKVDASLEPTWTLLKEAQGDAERQIPGRARASFGAFQVDDRSEAHLRWTHGSALARLGDATDVTSIVTEAHREARRAVFENPCGSLADAAMRAGEKLCALGCARFTDPRPGLDPSGFGRTSTLVLHDGLLPATQLGLGSRRLASVAFQLAANDDESIILLDEVESGLEPHRLLHLLQELRKRAENGNGQVILTTHSPVAVEAVAAADLHVVRCSDGRVSIVEVPQQLDDVVPKGSQAVVRGGPSAMLANRIVVCEGKTEVGLCRALVRRWDSLNQCPAGLVGTAFRMGGGSGAPATARLLADLGYPVALFTDNDVIRDDWQEAMKIAKEAGVELFTWDVGASTEDQLIRDLPSSALPDVMSLAARLIAKEEPEHSLRDAVSSRLGGVTLVGLDPVAWTAASGIDLATVRAAIAAAAKAGKWFKTETGGEMLGEVLTQHVQGLATDCGTAKALSGLMRFAYALPSEGDADQTG